MGSGAERRQDTCPPIGREPTLADLLDPVALERRLQAARIRRAAALSAAPVERGAARAKPPSPSPSLAAAASPRAARAAGAPRLVACLAAGLTVAALAALLPLWERPPKVWHELAAMPVPRSSAPPAPAGHASTARVEAPAALMPLPPAVPADRMIARGPAPRPAGLVLVSSPDRHATRSTRNRPGGAPPEAIARAVGQLNMATIGRAAGALGVRERLRLPGLTLSLDRRGLRLKPRGGGGGRRRD